MNKIDMQNINSKVILNKTLNRPNLGLTNKSSKKNFDEVLKQVGQATTEIKFTKHAKDRMNVRNIVLSNEDITKIKLAIDKADNKGVNEALILMDNKAFIASIKTKTIITTVNAEQLKDNVFTNIDGAIVI
ncbi:TIGR02530 family flagellar biosynthesis protein [Brassicibacter mesophilus]|uniref:TIGR02530 family flagellar biosynthesis protein n=1 Tax=Brassicibacter mesophilus TaxID=745119 RepID=UPI003D1FE7D3